MNYYRTPDPQYELLASAGFSNPLPMAIRSAQGSPLLDSLEIENIPLSEENILPKRDHRITAIGNKNIYDGLDNFELIIDTRLVENASGVRITNCRDFTIIGSNSILEQITHKIKFFIEITKSQSFAIQGVNTTKGRNILIISNCSDFFICKCSSKNATGYGIIIHNANQFHIDSCKSENNLSSGVMILGRCKNGLVNNCLVKNSSGFFNHDAGIHLCATSPAVSLDLIPESCHEPLSIKEKPLRPIQIRIENCRLLNCRSQGIYLEGAINCLLKKNEIVGNNKEGICFDWGSCYNIFFDNHVAANGGRKNLSQEEIEVDFITEYPLLADGSSSMKLPGISLDNGCMNLICNNTIEENFGGGIKMIRTAMCNQIHGNRLVDNAVGINKFVSHFHGISILAVGAGNEEFTNDRKNLLDFLPSILNSITDNDIQKHHTTIFCDKLSNNNQMHGNKTERGLRILSKSYGILRRVIAVLNRIVWGYTIKVTSKK